MYLYKYRSFENLEFLLDILVHERLYCPDYKSLNDPFEGTFYAALPKPVYFTAGSSTAGQPLVKSREIKNIDDLIVSATKKRVCSLSSSCSDVRLWSFYASGHSGLVLEIDFSNHLDDVYRIQYVTSFPEFGKTLLTAPTEVDILTCKTIQWDYEAEFRIISDSEYYPINERINRIIIGQRASDNQVKIIEKITNGLIPIVKTKLDFDSIKIIS